MQTRLGRLKNKQKELLKKIKELERKELLKGKKYILKKQQIVGEYFLKKYKNKMDELRRVLDPVLKKVRDRKLFDLEIKKRD